MMDKPPFPAAPAPSDAEFAEAHRALLADGSIQFDLPMYQPPTRPPPPEWWGSLFDWMSGEHPVLRALVYVLLIAAALLVLWLVVQAVGRSDWWRRLWRGPDDAGAADESWRPSEAPARALLGEADSLAAEGRFSEAAHLLLYRSIADLDDRRPELVRPALTSRDIAALPAIPERPRGAFARIAMLVERSLFARRALAEGDWRECRSAYEEFAFADGWRG